MHNIIILEDDFQQLSFFKKQLLNYNPNFIIQEYTNDKKFVTDLKTFPDYSIFLMDIVLTHYDGIKLAQKVNESIKGSVIIFVTGFIQKAADIYDANHCYFIYKPDLEKRLPLALDKAINTIKELKQSLVIHIKGNTTVIFLDDIIYLEKNLRKTIIHLKNEKLETYENFSSFEHKLTSHFLECHRSFIVNFNKVKQYNRNHFIMTNGDTIPISRSHEKNIKQQFQKYLVTKI